MATYQENYERNKRINEARKELVIELIKDPNSDKVRELKYLINSANPLRFDYARERMTKGMMPWIKY